MQFAKSPAVNAQAVRHSQAETGVRSWGRLLAAPALLAAALAALVGGHAGLGKPGDGVAGVAGEPRAGVFLVARPQMPDPRFARSVILLVEHGPDGSAGLIVNRRSDWSVGELLTELGPSAQRYPLWFGGPVAPYLASFLVQTDEPLPRTVPVLEGLRYGADRETLRGLMERGYDPARLHVFLGYAGWGPAQLDAELLNGDWLLLPATVEEVMAPDGLWERLIEQREPSGMLVRRALSGPGTGQIVNF